MGIYLLVRKLFVDSSQTFFVQFCLRVLEKLLLSFLWFALANGCGMEGIQGRSLDSKCLGTKSQSRKEGFRAFPQGN